MNKQVRERKCSVCTRVRPLDELEWDSTVQGESSGSYGKKKKNPEEGVFCCVCPPPLLFGAVHSEKRRAYKRRQAISWPSIALALPSLLAHNRMRAT